MLPLDRFGFLKAWTACFIRIELKLHILQTKCLNYPLSKREQTHHPRAETSIPLGPTCHPLARATSSLHYPRRPWPVATPTCRCPKYPPPGPRAHGAPPRDRRTLHPLTLRPHRTPSPYPQTNPTLPASLPHPPRSLTRGVQRDRAVGPARRGGQNVLGLGG